MRPRVPEDGCEVDSHGRVVAVLLESAQTEHVLALFR